MRAWMPSGARRAQCRTSAATASSRESNDGIVPDKSGGDCCARMARIKPVKPVAMGRQNPVKLDSWYAIEFEAVTTTALRLELVIQEGWAAGNHE
jgi:hypothetical protein